MAEAPEQNKMEGGEAAAVEQTKMEGGEAAAVGEPVKLTGGPKLPESKPEYLDCATNVLNVRFCCPSITFKLCPCLHCSIFTCLLIPIIACFKCLKNCCCSCFVGCKDCGKGCKNGCCNCVAGCFGCLKKCALTLCSPCIACAKCFKNCLLKCCAPCINCAKGCCNCLKNCCGKLNCCNFACGLPCYNPPGCVCIFPLQLCGLGVTCPYCPVTCGCKHCFLMPKEEQNWWHNQKVSKAEAKKLAQEAKEEKTKKKASPAAKDKEIEDLKAKIAQLEAGSLKTEPEAGHETANV